MAINKAPRSPCGRGVQDVAVDEALAGVAPVWTRDARCARDADSIVAFEMRA